MVARSVDRAHGALRPSKLLPAGTGWRSLRRGGSTIVVLSAAVVGCMVASLVCGPGIDRVMARDGYSSRDLYSGPTQTTPEFLHGPRAAVDPSRRQASWPSARGRVERWASRGTERRPAMRWASAAAPDAPTLVGDGTHTVCVRLCDGYHFPIGDTHRDGDLETQSAVCSSACPGAPTRLFTMASSGGDIDAAISVTNGQPYAALPVAYAHTTAVGPTCTCHRDGEAVAALTTPLNDITMRRGDSIMTPVGWRVFRGTAHWPYSRSDFSSLRGASLPSKTRRTLVALENASLIRTAAAHAAASDLRVRVSLKGADEPATAAPAPGTVFQR